MKTYAIAYMNYFDNILEIVFGKFESENAAAFSVLASKGWDISDLPAKMPMEEIKQFCFDGDCMIEIKEIPSDV